MYKKIECSQIQQNVFQEIGKNWVLISAMKDGVVNTMTASWGGLGVLWNLDVATIYVRPQRYTHEFIEAGDYFTITFFDDYKKELAVLGKKSGRDGDKIKEVGFTIEYLENLPTFTQGTMTLLCKKQYVSRLTSDGFIDPSIDQKYYPDKDYHDMYVGEIVSVYQNKNED